MYRVYYYLQQMHLLLLEFWPFSFSRNFCIGWILRAEIGFVSALRRPFFAEMVRLRSACFVRHSDSFRLQGKNTLCITYIYMYVCIYLSIYVCIHTYDWSCTNIHLSQYFPVIFGAAWLPTPCQLQLVSCPRCRNFGFFLLNKDMASLWSQKLRQVPPQLGPANVSYTYCICIYIYQIYMIPATFLGG